MSVTQNGRAVMVASVLFVAAGVVADYPELVAVGLAGLAALAVAALSLVPVGRLSATRHLKYVRVAEGQPVECVLAVDDVGRRRGARLEVSEHLLGKRTSLVIPELAAGDAEFRYTLPGLSRGVHSIPPCRLGHTDPLRLVRRERHIGQPQRLVVYPLSHRIKMAVPSRDHREEGSDPIFRLSGASTDSLRAYEVGDDWRSIHWATSARAGALIVRDRVASDRFTVTVLLDVDSRHLAAESFEEAVRVAASLVLAAAAGHIGVDLLTVGMPQSMASVKLDDARSAMDFLAAVQPAASHQGERGWLSTVQRAQDGRADTILVTGSLGQAAQRALRELPPTTVVAIQEHYVPVALSPRGFTWFGVRSSEDFASQWNGRPV